jgi:hypothetical protein
MPSSSPSAALRAVGTRRVAALLAIACVLALGPLAAQPDEAAAGPIADSPEAYTLCGRVFPDPQAYWVPTLGEDTPHPGDGTSPYAKGNAACAARTFISYDEAIRGMRFLADELPTTRDFVDVIDLSRSDAFDDVLREELGDGYSEGLGLTDGRRDQVPLYLIKVTAPEGRQLLPDVQPVPEAERDHFVWTLSIHGIERAGAEGGLRAAEDLATWAATEPERPLLETAGATITTEGGREAENLRAGEVMMRSVSYFILPNPDGWRRGDADQGHTSFHRFNGNGMDLNRDWPEIGYVDPTFTPWSESESRTFGRALQAISDNWTGGIDLHGMVNANAFSYTLIGGSQRPFDKNERTMEFVEQAWRDAETRLAWSSIIKPNSAPEQCAESDGVGPNGDTHLPPGETCDQRAYGVQYGTIWDTISYTATGALGNWIDSPIGLDADGIDNEMMLSHLGNCGIGTCYVPEAEQLHVDGNKGLIYSMLNFSLQPVNERDADFGFDLAGTDVGYLVNPRRLVDPGVTIPAPPAGRTDAPDLQGIAMTSTGQTVLTEWTVDNANGPHHIAGISGSVRFQNANGESVHLGSTRVQYQAPGTTTWVNRPVYGSDGLVYRVAGAHSDWNHPRDGKYRLIATTTQPQRISWQLELSTEPVFEDPVQAAFDVSNMDFFTELEPWLAEGTTLTAVSVDEVLADPARLSSFDTVIAVDGALLPGYTEMPAGRGLMDLPPTRYTAADARTIGQRLREFAETGGNVVLTDDALQGLTWMGLTDASEVSRRTTYAGHAVFSGGYDHPIAQGANQPGSAEGAGGRRQVVEPLPLGYAIPNAGTLPQFGVATAAVQRLRGDVVATTIGAANVASVAQIPVGAGKVVTFGSMLTFPTTQYYHPFGLSSYGITDIGYTLLRNALAHQNPAQSATPDLADDQVQIVNSGIPTRVYIDNTNVLPFS